MDLNPLARPEKVDFGPGRCQQGHVWGRRHLVAVGAPRGAPRAGIKLRVTGQPAWLTQDGGTGPCPSALERGFTPHPAPGAPQTARGSPPPSLTPAFNPPGAPGVAARLRPGLGGSRQGPPPSSLRRGAAAAQSSYSCQRLWGTGGQWVPGAPHPWLFGGGRRVGSRRGCPVSPPVPSHTHL